MKCKQLMTAESASNENSLAARDQHHSCTVCKLLLQLRAVCSSCSLPFQHRHVPHMLQRCLHHLMLPGRNSVFQSLFQIERATCHSFCACVVFQAIPHLQERASNLARPTKSETLFCCNCACARHCIAHRLSTTDVSKGFL